MELLCTGVGPAGGPGGVGRKLGLEPRVGEETTLCG